MKNFSRYYALAFVLVLGLACNQAPKADKAKIAEPKTETKAPEATPVTGIQKADVVLDKSSITWIGTKPTGKHNGTIGLKGGALALKDGTRHFRRRQAHHNLIEHHSRYHLRA